MSEYARLMPALPQDSPVIWDYGIMKRQAGFLGLTPVDLSLPVALSLAEMSPYPRGVKLGIMKQVANGKPPTLRQMAILLGWAADRAQR